MERSDSDREYRRWQVEHARNPETETTPRSAAADAAGESLLSQKLGNAALQIVKEYSSKLALNLTRRPGRLEIFGSILLDLVDADEVPSRMEIHQTLINEGIVEPDALVSDQVESRRQKHLLNQLEDDEILAIAMTLCQSGHDYRDLGVPASATTEESQEAAAALSEDTNIQRAEALRSF